MAQRLDKWLVYARFVKHRSDAAVMILVIAGGLMYSVGAVVYGLKRPNPIPKHFGFHEIFHALTVAAFFCHWVAALLVGLSPIPGSLGSV